MGLLAYINAHKLDATRSGLLEKAEAVLHTAPDSVSKAPAINETAAESAYISFASCAEETGLNRIALLIPSGGIYRMFFAHGFSDETIRKSVSTYDFWDGTLQQDGWNTFKAHELPSFYQFFSESDHVAALHIKRLQEQAPGVIFMIAEHTADKHLDLGSADIVISSLLPEIDCVIQAAESCTDIQDADTFYAQLGRYIFRNS